MIWQDLHRRYWSYWWRMRRLYPHFCVVRLMGQGDMRPSQYQYPSKGRRFARFPFRRRGFVVWMFENKAECDAFRQRRRAL